MTTDTCDCPPGTNSPHRLSLEMARAVWEILVAETGVMPGLKDDFIYHQRRGCREYRIQGRLGFGGKFWNFMGYKLHVNCYPEDLTDERGEIILKTDARLALLTEEADPCR